MEDKSTQLLQEILNQQKEQTELFRRHLWRLRFSLLGLLLVLTLSSIGIGVGVYLTRPVAPTRTAPRYSGTTVITSPSNAATWPSKRAK